MKPNLPLQTRMQRLYQRFKQSNLTRAAFCREEGITASRFTYWCRRFEQYSSLIEANPAPANPTPITLAQVSTPIQVVKELEESKSATPETTSCSTDRRSYYLQHPLLFLLLLLRY